MGEDDGRPRARERIGRSLVIINALQVSVESTARPVAGWYAVKPGCGAEPVRLATVDLDAPAPRVAYVDDEGRPSKLLALSVTRTDPELIELHAATERRSVAWTLEVVYSAGGRAGSVVLDEGDAPFRVTTETASRGYRRAFDDAGGRRLTRERDWDDEGIVAC